MTYDPEKGSARDLPVDRYVRTAYRLLRMQGDDLLIAIAERGETEFIRVATEIFGANGFVLPKSAYEAMFPHLERQAKRAAVRQQAQHDWMDLHLRTNDKPGRPS